MQEEIPRSFADREQGQEIPGEKRCPECGSAALDDSLPTTEAVCTVCGFVIEDLSEVQSPVNETDEEQIEGYTIPWTEYHTVTNSTEKRIAHALEHLESIGSRFDLDSDIRSQAADVYAEAAVANLTDGRSTTSVVAGAVVIGAREGGVPLPVACVADVAGIDRQTLNNIVRLLSYELDRTSGPCPPDNYLPFLCRKLSIDDSAEEKARQLLEVTEDAISVGGKNPVGVAGAALYLATDSTVTLRAIASAAGVSQETLRVRLLDCREAWRSGD